MSTQTVKQTTLKMAAEDLKKENLDDKNITIFVGKGTLKANDPFVILFYKNVLHHVLKANLTMTDIKIMLTVLDYVSRGNVVNLSQTEIAHVLNMKKQQVSRSWKNLIRAEIFLTNECGSVYLNPDYMAKQSLKSMKDSTAYSLAKATNNNEDIAF